MADPGDMIRLEAPARDDIAIFIENLPYDRMCAVEIIKEKVGNKYKSVDDKQVGVRYITRQKYCNIIFKAEELLNLKLKCATITKF